MCVCVCVGGGVIPSCFLPCGENLTTLTALVCRDKFAINSTLEPLSSAGRMAHI